MATCSTCAKPMKDHVKPQAREGDVSTRHVNCRRKVLTIKKFAVLALCYKLSLQIRSCELACRGSEVVMDMYF